MNESRRLKKDVFGEIRVEPGPDGITVIRDSRTGLPWLRWLARSLLQREARALACLDGLDGVPELIGEGDGLLARRYIPGAPLQVARPTDPGYFRAAAILLRRLHRAGIVHNDLAKEPNFLVRPDGRPAIIDFQLAMYLPRRGRLFRLLGYEDIRHLLKHKRTHCPRALSERERRILADPGPLARLWRATVRPAYLVVTRRLLGWSDREGAGDRGGTH
jgi:RIO-like serine/threonine protein kinase